MPVFNDWQLLAEIELLVWDVPTLEDIVWFDVLFQLLVYVLD